MSKCRPESAAWIEELGITVEEQVERSVVIKIPYETLLADRRVQEAFSHVIRITSPEEEEGEDR